MAPQVVHPRRLKAAAALCLCLAALSGCAQPVVDAAPPEKAVTLAAVPGSALRSVTLSYEAARRVGIATARLESVGGALRVPYSAIVYDEHGGTWVYTNPADRTFVRAPVVVGSVEGDVATLTSGPNPGTVVATVGVAELYGSELGVGDPE